MPGTTRELTNVTDFPRAVALVGTEVVPAVTAAGEPVGIPVDLFLDGGGGGPPPVAVPKETSRTYIANRNGRGVSIYTATAIRAGAPVAPLYNGSLWVAEPRLDGADVKVKATLDNAQLPDALRVLAASGLVFPAAWATDYIGIAPYFGHSDAQGSPDNAAITTADVDAGNALMFTTATMSPYSGIIGVTGLSNLKHGSLGETPCAGDYKSFADAIVAAGGTKLPTVYFSAAVGGSRLTDLLADGDPALAYWQRFSLLLSEAIYWIKQAGKTPVMLPMVLGHFDPDDSIATPYLRHTGAEMYYRQLTLLRDKVDAVARLAFGWNPLAPKLPLIVWQTTEEPKGRWTGSGAGTPVFGDHLWAASQAQFLAHIADDGILCAGPDYWCPSHTDNQHRTSLGYYQIGHAIGRCRAGALLGKPFAPLAPVSISSVNSTTTDIVYEPPDGGSLVLDTTIVPDYADTFKGFRLWKRDSAGAVSEVAISAVALQGTKSIRLTHTAPAISDRLVVEYAMYATDRTYSGLRGPNGPRGNVRNNVVRSTPYGNTYDWSMKFACPVPQFHASVAVTRPVRDLIRDIVTWW